MWLVAVADSESLSGLSQFGAFGAAIAVAWWLIRRSDARSDEANDRHNAVEQRWQDALKAEQAAHEATRQALLDALRQQREDRDERDE